METTGQTMGLDETLDSDGVSGKEENGIDIHMMLPTEYGAVAILSASGYGNPGKIHDETNELKRTTTGNATGVYYTGNRGEILCGFNDSESKKYYNGPDLISKNLNDIWGWHDGDCSHIQSSTAGRDDCNPCIVIGGINGMFGWNWLKSRNYWTSGVVRTFLNAWNGEHHIYSRWSASSSTKYMVP